MLQVKCTVEHLHRFLRLSGLLFDPRKAYIAAEIPSYEWLVTWATTPKEAANA
jgi:hypothetical protein